MQQNFDLFYTRVLQDEGTGYEWVEGDSGGPTACGVTIGDVARYNGLALGYTKGGTLIPGARDWDKCLAMVKELNPRTAQPIYKRYYWTDVRADELPSGLDYGVADFAVNSGESRSCNFLASLLSQPHSGTVTDAMLTAIRAYPGGIADLITHFQDCRKAFLIEIAQQPHNMKFRNGWLARESRVRKQALDLAAAAPPLPPVPVPSPKAMEPVALVSPPGTMKTAGTSKTVWAAGVSFLAPILAGIHAVTHAIGSAFVTLYQDFPSIVSDAKGTVDASTQFATMLGAEQVAGGMLVAIGVVATCVVVQRHVQLKKQNLQAA